MCGTATLVAILLLYIPFLIEVYYNNKYNDVEYTHTHKINYCLIYSQIENERKRSIGYASLSPRPRPAEQDVQDTNY